MSDILQVQGINEKGFGIIPKMVMQDKQLTAEAKAIYSYFCSYAGAGKTAFPSRDKIVTDLGLSKSRFYTHFNKLKEYGYIKVEQEKGNKGQFKRNIYTLVETLPCPEIKDTEKNNVPCPSFPCPDNPCTENKDTKNNIFKNKQSFKNISQSSPSVKEDRQDTTDDTARKIEAYTEMIKDNINYNDLTVSRKYDLRLIDEFIAIILDVVMTEGKTVRINGEDKPRELVKHNLLRLTYEDIEHAVDQFKGVTERISKKKQYIITMLYNCKMELDSHYTNLVNHDKWQ